MCSSDLICVGLQWEAFMTMIEPLASEIPLMVVLGNHERDDPGTGSIGNKDSGGECGVATSRRFSMPMTAPANVITYYAYSEGSVAIVMVDSEISIAEGSPQHTFLTNALRVDRSITPWLVVALHRPVYGETRNTDFAALEKLFIENKVDLVLQGHEHDAQVRLFAVFSLFVSLSLCLTLRRLIRPHVRFLTKIVFQVLITLVTMHQCML